MSIADIKSRIINDEEIEIIGAVYEKGNLAVALRITDPEVTFGSMTLNLDPEIKDEDCAYLDVATYGPDLVDYVMTHELGEITGEVYTLAQQRGSIVPGKYPLVKFDKSKLRTSWEG